jgi:hypothetical protein
MKAKGIKAMMTLLEKKGVYVCGTTHDFYGTHEGSKGIWIAADHTPALFDYWNMKGDMINSKLNAAVKKSGWWFEWNDPGTMMCWPNQRIL